MLREILPNIVGPMLADFGLRFVYVVLLLSEPELPRPGRPAARRPTGARWCARTSTALADGGAAVIVPALAIAT